MNLAEGYLGRAPPDIVRSVMQTSFSHRNLYSGKDGMLPVGLTYEDNRTQTEKHKGIGAGGTWPRQMPGPFYAKYPDGPLDNSSATLPPPSVLLSPRSRSSPRFLSQSVESTLWGSDGQPRSARDGQLRAARDGQPHSAKDGQPGSAARDPFVSAVPPAITIQDFSAAITPPPGLSHNADHHSPSRSERRQPESSSVTTAGAGQQLDNRILSPRLNDRRRYDGASQLQGPFYAIGYDNPHEGWNDTGGTDRWGSETAHHSLKRTGGTAAAETGTGECYTRVTQHLRRDSEKLVVDKRHPAISQISRYNSEPRTRNESNRGGRALLAFPLPGYGSAHPVEKSRNPDYHSGYVSASKMQHLWRNHIDPIDRGDLSGSSGNSSAFNRAPTDSSDSWLAARLAYITSRQLNSYKTQLDTTVGERLNDQPRSQYSHDRNFSDDRTVSRDETLSNDCSFSQDRSFSHDESFAHNQNPAHDRSFSGDGPLPDSGGTAPGKRTLFDREDHLHRRATTLDDRATSEPVKGQETGSRFIKEFLSRRGENGRHDQDLAGSGGLTETMTPAEGTTTATECGKAMMGQHKKWIQMEDRLLSHVYELQKERSQLAAKVEELTAANLDLSGKFRDSTEQLEAKELEMENVRRQLREKIVDMTSTVYSSCSQFAESTPPTSHRDVPRSNQRRWHDDDGDVDARRGRQVAQEELAACQIRFARERERWISEKIKVVRYQQLLQAKYEQVIAENQLLKEQVEKGFCQTATPIRGAMTQQKLTILKDGPLGPSFDSVC